MWLFMRYGVHVVDERVLPDLPVCIDLIVAASIPAMMLIMISRIVVPVTRRSSYRRKQFCMRPCSCMLRVITRLALLVIPVLIAACIHNIALAEEQVEAAASPKKPWGEFTVVEETSSMPWWQHVLLWVPNRFLDLIDVFRLDVGAGVSYGAVARISKYGQVGYRDMAPLSVRIGNFGREVPFMIERSSELGIGPAYLDSKDREVCPGEIGIGADIVLVGAYGGICAEELLDFLAGVFFLDVMGDDIK